MILVHFVEQLIIRISYLSIETVSIHINSIFLWYWTSTHPSWNNSLSLFRHWLAILHWNVTTIEFWHFPAIIWLFVTSVVRLLVTHILVSITFAFCGVICFTNWIVYDTLKSWIYKSNKLNVSWILRSEIAKSMNTNCLSSLQLVFSLFMKHLYSVYVYLQQEK